MIVIIKNYCLIVNTLMSDGQRIAFHKQEAGYLGQEIGVYSQDMSTNMI